MKWQGLIDKRLPLAGRSESRRDVAWLTMESVHVKYLARD